VAPPTPQPGFAPSLPRTFTPLDAVIEAAASILAAQKASSTAGLGEASTWSTGSMSLPRPRCSADLTVPGVVESASAISSSVKLNASLSTTAARSCGESRDRSVPAASRTARGSLLDARCGSGSGSGFWARTRSIHRFEAIRKSHARGFPGISFMHPSLANARKSAS